MFDYIQVVKYIPDKDSVFWGHCQLESEYSSGWMKYLLRGCEKIELWWLPSERKLRLEGSIPYYFKGHNWNFSIREFGEAIYYIGKMINVPLWDATVEELEYGTILEVDELPKLYIRNHSSKPKEKLLQNEKPKDRGCFRWWEDKNVSIKMYDAGRNIKNKLDTHIKSKLTELGWNSKGNYLKFEVHYKRAAILNNSRSFILAMLMQPEWQDRLREDLFLQYDRLLPKKSISMPTSKKELKTADILTLALVEAVGSSGNTIDDAKKAVYEKINSISDATLNKSDKDARKRQIRSLFANIKEDPESKWDLSRKLVDVMSKK